MRRRSRSSLAVVVSFGLVLAVGLSGCGDTRKSGPRPMIGFVIQNTKLGFAKEWSEGFPAGAGMVGGVDATVLAPPTDDGAKQVELFRQLTTSAQGGIAAAPSVPGLFARPEAEAGASGIPVVAVSTPPVSGSGVKLLLGNDSYALGEQLADEAIRRLPPKSTGKVVLGNVVPGQRGQDQRAKGMRDRFAEKMPSLRVIGPFDTQLSPSGNLTAWQALVAANPDALAFLGTGDLDAISLAGIRASTKGTWLAAGYSLDDRALQAIKDGQLFAVVSPEHFLNAAIAGRLLAEHAKNGTPLPAGWFAKPGLVITSANVDEIIQRQASQANKLAWFKEQIDTISTNPAPFLRPLDQVR